MEIDTINKEIIISPCSPRQLAAAYGVSTKVLRTWLRQLPSLNKKINRVYSLSQLFDIIELIGLPFNQDALLSIRSSEKNDNNYSFHQ